MIEESTNYDFVHATGKQLKELTNEDKDRIIEKLRDAPIIHEGAHLYTIVDGVAYPMLQLAERLEQL